MQYGKSLRYAGHVPISTPFDEVIINGTLDQENFDRYIANLLTYMGVFLFSIVTPFLEGEVSCT